MAAPRRRFPSRAHPARPPGAPQHFIMFSSRLHFRAETVAPSARGALRAPLKMY